MSKQQKRVKKKRDKTYRGEDAAVTATKVTRVSVPDRSKLGEWWIEHKKQIRLRAISLSVFALLFLFILLVVSWIF